MLNRTLWLRFSVYGDDGLEMSSGNEILITSPNIANTF